MDKDFSDMMNKFADMMGASASDKNNNSYNNSKNNSNVNSFNFDIANFVRLKAVMDKMNSAPDPRSNLLKSLKPYLRNERQDKLDQYINLFSMSKIIEVLKQTGGENNGK